MKVLVVGGTRYFGISLVHALLKAGHDVTIATRGRSKDPYENSVHRITFDRTSRQSIRDCFQGIHWDVVYDNINYSPTDTKNLLDYLDAGRYILTSSSAVYEQGEAWEECAFDPLQLKIRYGGRDDFSYEEGKRLCEAVLFQKYPISSVSVRFPVVLGENDYTRRLHQYIQAVKRSEALYIDNLDARLPFISQQEAGDFLAFLATNCVQGPINAASAGDISINELLKLISEIVGGKIVLSPAGVPGALNGYETKTLNTEKAVSAGFCFETLASYLGELISSDKDD